MLRKAFCLWLHLAIAKAAILACPFNHIRHQTLFIFFAPWPMSLG
jgi:hypothetical protein